MPASLALPASRRHATASDPVAVPWHERRGTAVAAGGVVALALLLPKALQVWSTGVFLDPDDAMRAVELRDFMGGQGWFDLVPHRLSPDHPFVMHWSRLVDLPLALLTRLFGLALPPAGAELAMRLVVPAVLLLATLWLMAGLARTLAGPRAMLPATLLAAGAPDLISAYMPGHIHHHAAQVTLLLGMSVAMLRAIGSAAPARAAATAGGLAVLSLGIGLQNLPFVVALAAVAGAAWVARGEAAAALLAGFGASVALAAALVYGLDVPPSAYGTGACDAFSTAHLLAATVGGLAALVLAVATPMLPRAPRRLAAGGLAAALVVGSLAALYPACLHDPMAGVDPVLREKWLAEVGEALPLARLIARDSVSGVALALSLGTALLATLAATLGARGARRAPWAALLLLGLVGLVGTLYQIRVAGSAAMLLVPGLAAGAVWLHDRLAGRPGRPALLAAVLFTLCGNAAAWTAVATPLARRAAPPAAPRAGSSAATDPAACFAPDIYRPLGALPAGLVLSTIDPGSTILAETPHSVLAAPYHRNADGNRVALLAFEATPQAARPLVAEAHPAYLALCRASNEATDTAAAHPESLAAALLAGHPPAWLVPIGDAAAPVLLYRVLP